jgi:hypothetical protein
MNKRYKARAVARTAHTRRIREGVREKGERSPEHEAEHERAPTFDDSERQTDDYEARTSMPRGR